MSTYGRRLRRRNIDVDRLTALNNRYRRRNVDVGRLSAFRRRGRLRRSNIDVDRLSAFRRRRRRSNIDVTRLSAFRHRRNNVDVGRLSAFRKNPDPEGRPWGPELYNPLKDKNHKFKDDSHYVKLISKLRRNPLPKMSGRRCPECNLRFNLHSRFCKLGKYRNYGARA